MNNELVERSEQQEVINNEEELAKKLYRLRKLKEEQAIEDERYQREIAESNEWYKPSKAKRTNQIDDVTALIEDYYQRRYAEDPYYRYKDRNGTVSKKTSTDYDYNDEELINSLPDELLKTTAKKAELKKLFQSEKVDGRKKIITDNDGHPITEDGEIIKGVVVKEKTEVTIKTTK
ncbi:host-nuclease inhibitor Gam family protein [Limosilactobacillus balticus]|uniref:Host-nuclease inhibitor Gam family protein n=1 Tax=Limosilactobacillus balticus TaxID=2759747 RepID=A0ABS8RJ32_9LACO|nr:MULTISPECIES: host-nuclease inhibitor Gam family protein [Limosilactobacillus]MCC4343582.1 host-nuclease inhibitor Gam family protein [Limosilactobacillus reuteri]MCC4356203.1 host-nuclease inhibitor Gam family protein [Limosilactobacillus reuteri]MCD7138766.1 host-nuclease inhibitor Gam family protein [Limosilactobacillus balticus]MCD7138803.1 host-nuclease inhibitor Gam family protein [Limosilactobacillus balticus]MCD7138894.1 host-nuclease inhibitor Gam family protein [Limosilactobacillu